MTDFLQTESTKVPSAPTTTSAESTSPDSSVTEGLCASGDTDAAEATTNLTPSSFPNSASILRSSVYWSSPKRLASHSRTRLMRAHVDQENVAADHLQNVIFPLVLAYHRASFV